MGFKLLTVLFVGLFSVSVGYKGWYFGQINGYEQAKAQFHKSSVIEASKGLSMHLGSQSELKSHAKSYRQAQFKIDVPGKRSSSPALMVQQQVAKMEQLIKKTERINRLGDRCV